MNGDAFPFKPVGRVARAMLLCASTRSGISLPVEGALLDSLPAARDRLPVRACAAIKPLEAAAEGFFQSDNKIGAQFVIGSGF